METLILSIIANSLSDAIVGLQRFHFQSVIKKDDYPKQAID